MVCNQQVSLMNFKIYYFLLLLLTYSVQIRAQDRLVSGKVVSYENEVQSNINLTITTIDNGNPIQFVQTDQEGNYKALILSSKAYKIKITSISFETLEKSIEIGDHDIQLDFILFPTLEKLDEIIINYNYSGIEIKKDTIIYDVRQFTNGSERKLKDQLSKLPGVEVTEQGQVFVNGKQVKEFLVEGYSFFNGGTKLGVENIPADAVEQVELIDNYSKISHMKDVSYSDDLAMNIKLKEDKKNFIFGDISSLIGTNKHYQIKTPLFYYSPKFTINLIQDINNRGSSTLNYEDIIRMDGFTSLYKTNKSSSLLNLRSFLSDKKAVSNTTNQFTSLDLRYSPSKSTTIKGLILFNKNKLERLNNKTTQYIVDVDKTIEKTNSKFKEKENFLTGRFSIEHQFSNKENVNYNVQLSLIDNINNNYINQFYNNQENSFDNKLKNNSFAISQLIEYHKTYNLKYKNSIIVEYNFNQTHPRQNYKSNIPFFIDSVLNDYLKNDFFKLDHIQKNKTSQINSNYIFFFTPTARHHFYTTIGIEYQKNNLSLNTYPTEKKATSTYNNNVSYIQFNPYAIFEYKFTYNKWENKASINFINYNTRYTDFSENHSIKKKKVEPTLSIKYEFDAMHYLKFDYKYRSLTPNIYQLTSTYILLDYNSISIGNNYLKWENSHAFSILYYNTKKMYNLNYNASLNYNQLGNAYLNNITYEDNLQRHYATNSRKLQEILSSDLTISYPMKTLEPSISLAYNYNEFVQQINNIETQNIKTDYRIGTRLKSRFKSQINFDFSYVKTFFNYENKVNNISYSTDSFLLNTSCKFTDEWNIKLSYLANLNSFGSKQNNQDFNFEIFFVPKKTSFYFSIVGNNLLNSRWKQLTTTNSIAVNEVITSMLPSSFLFSINYRL